MELSVIIPHIEALIFSSERPLTTLELCDMVNNALGFIEDRATLDQVEASVEAIKEKYASEFYPFEVRESGGGLQFLTKKEYHKTVAQINGDKFLKRLSTAALETLSIIAYKQPITKGEMEAIRGVNCDYAVQKLLEKELVVILGRNEKLPGHPLVYGTSRSFMDYFGINSPEDLPKIKEVVADELIEPTGVQSDTLQIPGDEEQELSALNESLVVTENGDLVEQAVEENETAAEETTDITEEVTADETAEVIDEATEPVNQEETEEEPVQEEETAEEETNDEPAEEDSVDDEKKQDDEENESEQQA
ncbi:MAG: SMC-Scp complex subunit ScpB [Lacibacter sp.]